MKFIFTGTGTSQGVPVIACDCDICQSPDPRDKRLRSSGVLQSEHTSLVFDTGPDFRIQMLNNKIKKLDAVVYTHKHKDHTAGMDDIRAFNYKYRKKMQIYANRATYEHIKKEYYYIFDENDYPALPQLDFMEINSEDDFVVGDIPLTPIPVMHHKLEVLGFRTGGFAYITDANFISDTSKKRLQNLEILVLNALRIQPHRSHFNLEEALAMVEELKPTKAYFTHISHFLGRYETIAPQLPTHVQLAYDGLTLEW